MVYQKKNIYDFSVKIDDDYYFVNGMSYKRIDIDICSDNNKILTILKVMRRLV